MGQNNFVVGIPPAEQNRDYSYHMNFSDMSTLQYLPAYQTLMWWLVNILHQELPVGKGNGWEVTNAINTYSVQFFDTFMKSEVNPAFSNCNALSNNTFIKCGPGSY